MKKLVLSVLFVSSMMTAQRMDVVKGNFDFLKGQKEINVQFDYSELTLMKEKKSEAAYIEDRTNDLNEKNKNVGDIWAKKWKASRELSWNPKFLELVNVVLSKKDVDVSFQEGLTAVPYTLIVKSVWIYPGWDVMMMKQPAKVTTLLTFVETANPSNVLVEITSENAPGDQWGSNFSNETRIGEGYAKTGKSLAQRLLKSVYR
jgi:hypothetical protein